MKIEETFDLRNALGEGDRRLLQLEALVKFALFDPSEKVRDSAIRVLNLRYKGTLGAAFVGDNQVFVRAVASDGSSKIIYVCEKPESFQGRETKPHSFDMYC